MKRSFALYRRFGYRAVTGFLEAGNLPVLAMLDEAQSARHVSGAVAEIGVHHGRLFIPLQLLQRGAGNAVAIDLFGLQELNVDKSGRGDLDKFLRNVELWSSSDNLVIHQGDSTKLSPDVLLDRAGGSIRLFSVDGGHTEEIVLSDMRLAEATLSDGGIVIADDVFNQQWPGVVVGTMRYLEDRSGLVPFAIGFNKTFFTQPEHAHFYRDWLKTAVARDRSLQSDETTFAGHPVQYVAHRTAVDVLRQNRFARGAYHRTYNGLVGALRVVSRSRQ